MKKINELASLINDLGTSKAVINLVSNFISKIKELEHTYNVKVVTDLNKLEKDLINKIKKQSKLEDNPINSNIEEFKPRYGEFWVKYKKALFSYMKVLNSLKITRYWLDTKELYAPFLKLEIER